MTIKIKLLIIFIFGFLPVLLSFIFSPILQQRYLINCHDVTEKIFTACDVDQSSWLWRIDYTLFILATYGSPLIIGLLSALFIRRELFKNQKYIYIIFPVLLIMILISLTVLLNFIFKVQSGQDYLGPIIFISIITVIISLFIITFKNIRVSIKN